MILDAPQIRSVYAVIAKFYDPALSLYYIFGLRRRRRQAVRSLALEIGDTVVDLGCGTGANLQLLLECVGPTGSVIGVDLSDEMLNRARNKVDRAGWRNVRLINEDLRTFELPKRLDGAIATYALEMVAEHEVVVARLKGALRKGGRVAVLGLKEPTSWPNWLVNLAIWLNRPFGVNRDYVSIQPWLSVRKQLNEVLFQEMYAGAGYLSVGQKL